MLSLGLMSGTSMDGIDAALVETDGLHQINAIEHLHLPYDQHTKQLLKSAERAMHAAQGNLAQAKTNFPKSLTDYLSQELHINTPQTHDTTFDDVIALSTHLHEMAVRQLLEHSKIQSDDIDVIGYHGQTLFHQPKARITYQMGDAHQLAHRLQIPVVYNIRQNDIQHGGQGAPFAPLYHQALAIRDNHLPLVVLNCGGLANMSLILGDSLDDLIGFDTGPGNGLMDAFIKKKTQGRETMDRDGHYGLQGTVQEPILQMLLEQAIPDNYLLKKPPKSLDIRDLKLLPILDTLSLYNALATLEAFTAESIVQSLDLLTTPIPNHWILAGGGWHNPVIKRELIARLHQRLGDKINVSTADALHWNSDAMEAQMMAYLAVRSLKNLPLSAPGTTGVPIPLTGGSLIHVVR